MNSVRKCLVNAQFDTSLTNLNKAVGPGTKPNLNGDIATSISTVVSAILGILGTIFFVLTVYAGVKWMLARGDEGEIEKAKEIIKAAVIGLVVTLAAYAITYFIGTRLTRAVSPSSPGNDAVLGCCVNADHSVCAASSSILLRRSSSDSFFICDPKINNDKLWQDVSLTKCNPTWHSLLKFISPHQMVYSHPATSSTALDSHGTAISFRNTSFFLRSKCWHQSHKPLDASARCQSTVYVRSTQQCAAADCSHQQKLLLLPSLTL
jgi:hypothetical protein